MALDRPVTLTVHLNIPITNDRRSWPALVFGQWVPGITHGPFTRRSVTMSAKLSIDQSAVDDLATNELEIATCHNNMSAHNVNVDVQIDAVQPELAEFIWSENGRNLVPELPRLMQNADYARLRNDYQRLGREVLEFGVETYNRLIEYARTEKRQYWLDKQRFDMVNPAQSTIGFGATVSADTNGLLGRIRFDPFPNIIHMTVDLDLDKNPDGTSRGIRHAIQYQEFDIIENYLETRSRPRAVLELVANAMSLLDAGYERSAVVEAAAALETAVVQFFLPKNLRDRAELGNPPDFGVDKLAESFQRIGFANSVKYLLPLTLSPETLPQSLLDDSYELIEIRNNTAHNAQRTFLPGKSKILVRQASKLCQILMEPNNRPMNARQWVRETPEQIPKA